MPTKEQLERVAKAARGAWGQYTGHDAGEASGLMDAMAELEAALEDAGMID